MNQQTAQGLASLGRGPDSMLVHMAPQEVAGLQALAMKHGGSLTINPETGLPEAGFLSSILPMVAGFALGPAGFGLMSSAMAGITVGGISAITSKSLSKGLMAGLGAYGGAGLGESLMNAGTGSLSSGATVDPSAVVPQAPVFEPASVANAANSIPASGVSVSSAVAPAGMQPLAGVPGKFVTSALPQPATVPAINAAAISPTVTPTPVLPAPSYPTALSQSAADIGNVYAQEQAAQNAVAKALANKTPTDLLGAGFDAAKNAPGAFLKKNMLPLGALGISALSGMNNEADAPAQNQGMIRPYTYSREKVPSAFMDVAGEPLSSKERRYFTDRYTALTPYKAPGPEYMAAEGGPVEEMSNGNNIAAYMGRDKFAEGGSIGGYTFDPRTGIYTKPSGEGATTASPTGGASRASGEGDGDPFSYINPNVAKETFEEQSARNQQFNDLLTNLSTVLSPGATILSGLLSTPLVGAIANAFGGTQAPAPVESAGTSLGGGLGSPAAQGQTSSQSGEGNPGEQGGQTSSDTGVGNPGESYAYGGLAALAQGGSIDTSAPQKGLFKNLLPPGGTQGGSIGGYTYDPVTQTYSKTAGDGVDPNAGLESSGMLGRLLAQANMQGGTQGGSIGGYTYNPHTQTYGRDAVAESTPAMAQGGISSLGDYSDGGRLLRGPGDGVSDDIPAMIGQKQQARLADGEFVVPARIVSELGNGSTEAGARQLYAMMDRVQKARKKTVGKDKVATNSRAAKLLPA